MKALLNLMQGFRLTASAWRMVGLLLLINLMFALILAVPMYLSLQEAFGSSRVTERMTAGFDYLWWEEYRDQAEGIESTFTPALIGKGAILSNLEGLIQTRFLHLPPPLLYFGILYLLLHAFLSGGILSVFAQGHIPFRTGHFLQGSARFFPRFLGILLISLIFFVFGVGQLSSWLRSLVNKAAAGAASEIMPFYLHLLVSIGILFVLLFLQMWFDYTRIKAVLEDNQNIFASLLSALGFVFRNPGSTLGLFYLIFLSNILVTLFYLAFLSIFPDTGFLGILTAFLVQQLFIFAVIWVRCWLYAAQMKLYLYLQ
jgi:hypothetical protein